MKFFFSAVVLALVGNAQNAAADVCLGDCTDVGTDDEQCVFHVSRDQFASELGYFKFTGAPNQPACEGTNPTLGMKKNVRYVFVQDDASNYYHALGFAYEADGALDEKPELEPVVFGEEGTADPGCIGDAKCPAPRYFKVIDGVNTYLGTYNNDPGFVGPSLTGFPLAGETTTGEENFGLDDYEPEFFYPLYDWLSESYSVELYYDEMTYEKDIFYFCHIHQFMTGRIKFVDDNGVPLTAADEPAIPYSYESPGAFDTTCGTSGLEDFQLPNHECPDMFVCDRPDGPVGQFAECVDAMNCAMLVGMTTNVNNNNAIALFNHQMIPHHQNAVNMCKALLISGEAPCTDLSNEDDDSCVINVICQEIINVQNAQIQTMRGVLDSIGAEQEDDCVVKVRTKVAKKSSKSDKKRALM